MTDDLVGRVARARTFLFVPGSKPELFHKAWACGADAVVLDLEDAVPDAMKNAARENVLHWIGSGHTAVVRVNGQSTKWHDDDIEAMSDADCMVMVPKTENADAIEHVAGRLSVGVVLPLVETAKGIEALSSIAASPVAGRLVLGTIDLAAELMIEPTEPSSLAYARARMVMSSAAAGLPGPVDGVTVQINDDLALLAEVAHARALGFLGKLCIHPRQVPHVAQGFLPTPEELAWAQSVLAGSGAGEATLVDGAMVDRPVVARAEAIVSAAVSGG